MKKIQLIGFAVLAALFAQVLSIGNGVNVSAEGNKAEVKTEKSKQADDKKQSESNKNEENDVVYEYIAQPGDSYSKMARKAAQTYGLKYKKDLGVARIIYIETNMTNAAGSPFLKLGEKVEIKESNIKLWVQKSMKLSAQDLIAWGSYAPYINFNTDNVGQK